MDLMDLDHNMDVDVDLVPDEPIVPEPDPDSLSPGEIDDDADVRCPTKVYIKGLDAMNPRDVKAYVAQHCPDADVVLERIEWIDDSSANLIFASETIASQALAALAAEPIIDVSQLSTRHLLTAKAYPTRPEIALQIRPALENDKKQSGAAARSRFYLLNPQYDPEERRRRNETRRYRDRDDHSGSRRRGRLAQVEEDEEPFDVNLYDDNYAAESGPAKSLPRRRRSYSPDFDRETTESRMASSRASNRGRELFPDGTSSRRRTSRDRSASPMRDRDGDRNTDGLANEEAAATRERNHSRAHAIKSHMSRQNRAKELFPSEEASDSGRLGDEVEDAATLLSKGIILPLMDSSSDMAAPSTSSRKLEDRITVPGKGKLADRVTTPDPVGTSAFSIRGAASQRNPHTGFAIKGAAGKSVKELFPDRFGSNAGKELFGDGSGGRSRQRQKAGDLFD